ncbi:MAG: MurT ligase domain-containing protein [Candidatus Ancillula sp.]|jgi:UDP-N-acetylmuramyl tripeptide synthase|nr:MurT ligase domain-containing protein [Candidatus Ancillula sp.]
MWYNEDMKSTPLAIPSILLGKLMRGILVVSSKNSGTALPGRVVELIDKKFLVRMFSKMKYGVLVVSGTNGKTTTTHIIAKLLEAQGLRVFTNRSGSNFTRGVISELVRWSSVFGNPRADIAVLELDEAYGVHFCKVVKPNYTVLLNVTRDQLDRFGEIDYTAKLLEKIAKSTQDSLILNREDPHIYRIKDKVKNSINISFFGLNPELRDTFRNDNELHSEEIITAYEEDRTPVTWDAMQSYKPNNCVILEDFENSSALYTINSHKFACNVAISGLHNVFNSAAAIAAVRAVMKSDIKGAELMSALANISSPFGRGETIEVNGRKVELVLVKNPAGFRLAMLSFEENATYSMVVINDEYADGRDTSWLWDVDFTKLNEKHGKSKGVKVVSGNRAYDMALRLIYSDIIVDEIEPDIEIATKSFINNYGGNTSVRKIYCTYTAMLKIRQILTNKRGLDI